MGVQDYLCVSLCGGPPWGFSVHNGDSLLITQVDSESPADVAGLCDGDQLVSLNGQSCANLTPTQVWALMDGPGDTLQLVVKRGTARRHWSADDDDQLDDSRMKSTSLEIWPSHPRSQAQEESENIMQGDVVELQVSLDGRSYTGTDVIHISSTTTSGTSRTGSPFQSRLHGEEPEVCWTDNGKDDSEEVGGVHEEPPQPYVTFEISADELDSESERDAVKPNKHRARHARLRRSESQSEKQVKEAKSRCKRIALLLTAAPNPNNKGVLMFKRHRQRAKKYTLVSYGTGENADEDEDKSGKGEHTIQFTVLATGESELDDEFFADAHDRANIVTFDWDTGLLEIEKKLEDGEEMERLPETKGKGALMFAQRRQRMDEIASEHEEMRRKGLPVEGVQEIQATNVIKTSSYQVEEHSYMQPAESQAYMDVNLQHQQQQQYLQHQHYQQQVQQQQQQQMQYQQYHQQQAPEHQQQYLQQQHYQQQQQVQYQEYQQQVQQTSHSINGMAHLHASEVEKSTVISNRTAKPFSGTQNRVPAPFSPTGSSSAIISDSQYGSITPQDWSPGGEQIASRDERISVPASRTGILQDTRKRNTKPMFTFKEAPKVSPNPELLTLLNRNDKKTGFESGGEEDYLSLGAEACNFQQSPLKAKQKTPPPVAPKPVINPASPPWSPPPESSGQTRSEQDISVSASTTLPALDSSSAPTPSQVPARSAAEQPHTWSPPQPQPQAQAEAQQPPKSRTMVSIWPSAQTQEQLQSNWVPPPQAQVPQDTSTNTWPPTTNQVQMSVSTWPPAPSQPTSTWSSDPTQTQEQPPTKSWTQVQVEPPSWASGPQNQAQPVLSSWSQGPSQIQSVVDPSIPALPQSQSQWASPCQNQTEPLTHVSTWPSAQNQDQPQTSAWAPAQIQNQPQTSPWAPAQIQNQPQTNAWAPAQIQNQPQTSAWAPAQIQNQPQTSAWAPAQIQNQPQTSAWAPAQNQNQPQTNAWAPAQIQNQPQTSAWAPAQNQNQPQTNAWAPAQIQNQPQTSAWAPAQIQNQPQTSAWAPAQNQNQPQTSAWAPAQSQAQPQWSHSTPAQAEQHLYPNSWAPAQTQHHTSWAPQPQQPPASVMTESYTPRSPPAQPPPIQRTNSYTHPAKMPLATSGTAFEMPALRGKGAELFAKRQSRMEKFVVDSASVQANKVRSLSPTPSLPSSWKYSSNIRAPPPLAYNPIHSPSYPPGAVKQQPSQSGHPAGAKTQGKGKAAPKPLHALDVMKHQPYQLSSSLFIYGSSVETKASPPKSAPASTPPLPSASSRLQPIKHEEPGPSYVTADMAPPQQDGPYQHPPATTTYQHAPNPTYEQPPAYQQAPNLYYQAHPSPPYQPNPTPPLYQPDPSFPAPPKASSLSGGPAAAAPRPKFFAKKSAAQGPWDSHSLPRTLPSSSSSSSSCPQAELSYKRLSPWEAASRSPLGLVDEAFSGLTLQQHIADSVRQAARRKSLPRPPPDWTSRVSWKGGEDPRRVPLAFTSHTPSSASAPGGFAPPCPNTQTNTAYMQASARYRRAINQPREW